MFSRLLNPSKSRSFFLFGARATGKSTLISHLFPKDQALWIDLLDPKMEDPLSKDPGSLLSIIDAKQTGTGKPPEWIVIDEIQKIPELLGIVHQRIRESGTRFVLTGSSARKLKRQGADLLAGRASLFELFPLTTIELGDSFQLDEVLNWGSLPELFHLSVEEKRRFLRAYTTTYLKEEILQEQLVRKVRPFREFLELAAIQNGQILNYSKFSKDVGVDVTTIQTYFEILVDTLLGFELLPFHLSIRKRQRQNPKFYFFDLGITRSLSGLIDVPIHPSTGHYGKVFEHFVILEFYRIIRTLEKDWRLSYLQTQTQNEIDLIIDISPNQRIAIEIKSNKKIDENEVNTFNALAKDLEHASRWYVSQDPIQRTIGGCECITWQEAVRRIFKLAKV